MPKRVFLQPKDLVRKSRHHTVYMGDGAITEPGSTPPRLYKLEFFNGVARDVPEDIYQRAKDLGLADVHKPSFEEEEEED